MFKIVGEDTHGGKNNRKDFLEDEFSEVVVSFEPFGRITKMWLRASTRQKRAVALVDRLPYSSKSLTVDQTYQLINTIEAHYDRY